MNRARRWILWSAAVTLLGIVASAPASSATVVEGSDLVVGKDMNARELTLLNGVVLRVTDQTKLISKSGVRITLSQIQVAPSKGGVTHALPDAMVHFEGRQERGKVLALTVRVMGHIPR
jgi:hypothetical protein